MKTCLWAFAIIAPFLVAGVVTPSSANAQSPQELDRSLLFPSNADIAAGESLAAEACGACHSSDGVAEDPTLPHLAGQHAVYLYAELLAYNEGRREDKSMSDALAFLSDDALRKVSVYFASLSPPDPAAAAESSDDAVADIVVSDPVQLGMAAAVGCAGCHGESGNSQMAGMPSLTAQSPAYFVAAMRAHKQGERQGSMMNSFAASVNEETVKNMAIYYAVQEPKRSAAGGSGDVEAGRAAAQACSTCHGADGNISLADTPTLAGQDALYLATSTKAYAEGKRDHAQMVTATADLSDVDIEDLASFYAAQEPIARKVHRPPTVAEWIERCDRCHGIGGNSSNPSNPSLASQNEAYLVRVIETYANGGRSNSTMSAMSQPLRPSDIASLAAHYASQKRKSILFIELPCAQANDE